jgi:hypothetical protein
MHTFIGYMHACMRMHRLPEVPVYGPFAYT